MTTKMTARRAVAKPVARGRREPALASNAALAAAVADAGYTADLAAAVVVTHDEPQGLLDRLLQRRTTRRPVT